LPAAIFDRLLVAISLILQKMLQKMMLSSMTAAMNGILQPTAFYQIIFTRMGTDSKTLWEPTKGAILETTRNKAMKQLPILLV